MLVKAIVILVRLLLKLRYSITTSGLDKINKKSKTGILFLPNHPGFIDPVIVISKIFTKFNVRPVGHADQVDRFFIRWVAKKINVLILPSLSKTGVGGVSAVRQTIDSCVTALKNGDNVVLYPSGALYRSKHETLGTNSGVELILREIPDLQIVMVRSSGIWGSSFSWGFDGTRPLIDRTLKVGIKGLLLSGLFFAPKRKVTLEFKDANELPRNGTRRQINSYLEKYYNEKALPATFVPYSIWDRSGIRQLPEPKVHIVNRDTSSVPTATREIVTGFITDRVGISDFDDNSSLAGDLGMDSLAISEIAIWIEKEFGFPQTDLDSLKTVGDLMLAAVGQAVSAAEATLNPVPAAWNKCIPNFVKIDNMSEKTICEGFLFQATRNPDKVVLADDNSGVKTYRDIVLGIMVLAPEIAKMPGKYIGIMLPASAAAPIIYLSVLFAGKVPVMVNWTQGSRNLGLLMDKLEVSTILTSALLVEKLKGQDIQLDSIESRLMPLETLGKTIPLWRKILCKVKSKASWHSLKKVTPAETAVVLFTSGSESVPKAVPLTHKNIMANIDSLVDYFYFSTGDIMLGMLPPFHSFGLTGLIVVPLVVGVRAVYSPNPNEGGILARIVEAYKVTFLLGTPTFLNGIVRAAAPGAVSCVRTIISGAEKCLPHVYDALEKACPNASVQEAYGITECSPGVCVNSYEDPRRETIGRIISCMEYAIIEPEKLTRVPAGTRGVLVVRGDNVFNGYLKHDGKSPFINFENKNWYNTGDFVIEDSDNVLTFVGRQKRFIKLGGEMISLPAIEEVLNKRFVTPEMAENGPTFAVLPSNVDENPELILFSTITIDRQQVNLAIRDAGLSGLHNIREIRTLEELPILGTGKQDYQKLSKLL